MLNVTYVLENYFSNYRTGTGIGIQCIKSLNIIIPYVYVTAVTYNSSESLV